MQNRKSPHQRHETPRGQRDGQSMRDLRPRDPREGRERAMLVSVLLPDTKADLRDPLGELQALAESAETVVVDTMVQKRTFISPGHALGKGKLADLVTRVEEGEIDVVIFDNDLTPRQIRGLERAVGIKVIDRSELILDIFALRARTKEAQLQVELAQLEYTAPRLRGLWTHLERIAGAGGATAAGRVGGVGTRGPGERQIEIDRRIVKDRISHLKREIQKIDKRKQREVKSRHNQFTVALVGYTNSGKTTLLNRLTGTRQYAADKLFATLDTKTSRWSLGEGRSVLLSDTVGFVRDLPPKLVASFRATLEEAIHADLLLHVIDASARTARRQMTEVDEVLKSLDCHELPQLLVLNKIDIADDASMAELLARNRAETIRVSAKTGEGLDGLTEHVARRMVHDLVELVLLVPHRDGKLRSEITQLADVLGFRYVEEGVELRVRMNRAPLFQLRQRYRQVQVLEGDLGLEPSDGA